MECGSSEGVEPEQDQCKRTVQLTAKALANKIEQLQKERKRNVNVIKSSIPTIKELMQRNENISAVRSELESLVQVFDEAIKLHDSVIPLLPSDEQTKQKDWFSSVYKHSDAFIKDTKQWIRGIESSSDKVQDQPLESA